MKKIIRFFISICILMLLIATSVVNIGAEVTKDYEQEFLEFVYGKNYDKNKDYVYYTEYYKYFSEDNDTDVPDWIFGNGYTPDLSPAYAKGVFGDYCISQSAHFDPYILGYFVYVPEENKFYDIIDAWGLGFENLELALSECAKTENTGIYLIGDADADGTLSVLDATHIQRALALLSEYREEDELIYYALHYHGQNIKYISDFDRDGDRTVMDATAIQMKLAGL